MDVRPEADLSYGEYLVAAVVLLGTAFALRYLLPTPVVVLGAVLVGLAFGVYGVSFLTVRYAQSLPDWVRAIPIWVMLLVPALIAVGFVLWFDVRFTLVSGLIFVALLLLIFVYWTVVPLALHQHLTEDLRTGDVAEWPSITVLVPAYDEEGYVGRCIDSFLAADYPAAKLEIIVIDDGSTDGTFAEARAHADGNVTVCRKANGGKHAALNYGLERATTDLVAAVDADSTVEPDALKELVRTLYARPNAVAVAGNVKVANRGTFLTDVQALEYIVSINMYRRALDRIGLVKVVPGCLGLFEREAVEAVGGFSGDTVTEDFDMTIELLSRGGSVHYSSRAIVRTEAPETVGDLYRQRLRWYRGTVQTVGKHRRVFLSPRFGWLHRLLAPYILLSLLVVPPLGLVVLGTIAWMVVFGSPVEFLGIFSLFASLEVLFSALAIRIEDDVDDESLWLVRYAPLMVLGYKQLQDLIVLKSLLDVLVRSDLGWTHAERTRHRGE